jgi:putative toxin-antitoxin system antitoxin component (TIGR02293 family)
LAALKGLALAGLSEQEIERFVIPQRTRRHRAERNERLTVEESDRAVRLLRVQTLAEETFGSHERANRWLRRSLTELDGEAPLVIAQTEAGARVIETILGKIAWGVAALCCFGDCRGHGTRKVSMADTDCCLTVDGTQSVTR